MWEDGQLSYVLETCTKLRKFTRRHMPYVLLLGGACKIAHYSFGGAEQPEMIALLLYNLCLVWGTAGPKEDTFLLFITTRPYHTHWVVSKK